jgi:hypothetical protein
VSARTLADEVREALARLERGEQLPREPHAVYVIPHGDTGPAWRRYELARYRIAQRGRDRREGMSLPCSACGQIFVRTRARVDARRCVECVAAKRMEPRIPLPAWVPAVLVLLLAPLAACSSPADERPPAVGGAPAGREAAADTQRIAAPVQIEPHCPDRHKPCFQP